MRSAHSNESLKKYFRIKRIEQKRYQKMEKKKSEGCQCAQDECDHAKIENPGDCTLNQVIKCHGDQPIRELFKHLELDKEE